MIDKAEKIYIVLASIIIFFLVLLEHSQAQMLKDLQADREAVQALHELNKLASNKKLGIANSTIATQAQLLAQYKSSLSDKEDEFEAFRKKHKLQISSRDSTIAYLEQKLRDGEAVADGECIKDESGFCKPVRYSWRDKYSRFTLIDDDIWTRGNEELEVSQFFSLKGEIFVNKSGKVKVRKIKIEELYDSGKYQAPDLIPVPDSNIQIVSNEFTYVAESNKKAKNIADIFTFRPFALADSSLAPGLGFELLNFGRLSDYNNFGLYTKVSANIKNDPLSSIASSKVGIGVNYQLVPPLLPTNFALGASVNLPFSNLAAPIFTLDAILYLTEDLNPFVEK